MEKNFDIIEQIASDARKECDRLFVNERNLTKKLLCLVDKLGGRVVGTSEPEYFEINGGSLRIKGARDFCIKLPMDTSPLRDNFTIAHELGHYLLHYKPEFGECIYARYGQTLQEIQANRFAAAFLMPKEEFIQAKKELNGSISRLAAKFQVSTDAVKERMDYIRD